MRYSKVHLLPPAVQFSPKSSEEKNKKGLEWAPDSNGPCSQSVTCFLECLRVNKAEPAAHWIIIILNKQVGKKKPKARRLLQQRSWGPPSDHTCTAVHCRPAAERWSKKPYALGPALQFSTALNSAAAFPLIRIFDPLIKRIRFEQRECVLVVHDGDSHYPILCSMFGADKTGIRLFV